MQKALLWIGFGLGLVSCGTTSSPSGSSNQAPLSGSLLPQKLGVGGQINVVNVAGQQLEVKLGTEVTLSGGHLPATVFDQQRSEVAAAVNSSALFGSADKAKLIAGANEALDKFTAAINSALDDLPRHMNIQPGGQLGDVAWANFRPRLGFERRGLKSV